MIPHPAILLKLPPLWDQNVQLRDGNIQVYVMYPHLQELGCPIMENRFLIYSWGETPELAVQEVGYRDLDDYWDWIYVPERRILERLKTGIQITKMGLNVFGLFPQGHGHMVSGAKMGLNGAKFLIEQALKGYK